MTIPGVIIKASGLIILGVGCLNAVSASAFGTMMFVVCVLLGVFLINETHRSEYRR